MIKAIDLSTELGKRVVTGVAGALGLILLLIFGGWIGILLLTAALALGMTNEFSQMAFSMPDQQEKRYAMLIAAWLVTLLDFLQAGEFELLAAVFIVFFTVFLLTARRYDGEDLTRHFKELMFSLFGLMYLAFVPLYLPKLYGSANGTQWTLVFLFIIWAGDTGAYFAGKKFGKRKLYPLISPKKTVEGALGGLAAGVVIAVISKLTFFRAMSWGGALVLPVIVGAVAQVGDLCESFLKRAFNKKDSGTLLPGHGGFMDRFDSVVFSLPVMYACIRVFG